MSVAKRILEFLPESNLDMDFDLDPVLDAAMVVNDVDESIRDTPWEPMDSEFEAEIRAIWRGEIE